MWGRKRTDPTSAEQSPTSSRSGGRGLAPYCFIVPAAAYILLVWGAATFETFRLSFTDAGPGGRGGWTGLANYAELAADPLFLRALLQTVLFSLAAALAGVAAGHLAAAGLFRQRLLRTPFLVALGASWITSEVVAALLWRGLLDAQTGPFGAWAYRLGLPAGFLASPLAARAAVLLCHLWGALAFSTALQLAALAGLPPDLAEAAALDGAGPLRRFFRVTLPLVKGTTAVNFVLLGLGAAGAFTEIWVLTAGGPLHSTEVVSTYIYRSAIELGRHGYASAAGACLLAVLAGPLGFILRRGLKERAA